MAVTNMIPELWQARLKQGFVRENVWNNLITDVSGEFASGGDTLHIGEVTSTGALADYTRNADIPAATQADSTDTTLVIDQEKVFNISMDDVDRVQTRPDIFDKHLENTSRNVAKVYDEFLSGKFDAGIPNGQKIQGAPALPNDLSTVTDANLQKLITEVNVMVEELTRNNWPLESTFAVMNTSTAFAIREYLVRKGIGQGQLSDSVFINGQATSLFGIRTVLDKNASNAQSAGAVQMRFGVRDAVYTAMQIRKLEAYRPERRMADAVKGLYVYGAAVVYPDHRYQLTTVSGG